MILGSRATKPAFAVTPGWKGMVQSVPAETPSPEDLHQGKTQAPKVTLPALRAVDWGAVGWRLFSATSALLLVLDMSWF